MDGPAPWEKRSLNDIWFSQPPEVLFPKEDPALARPKGDPGQDDTKIAKDDPALAKGKDRPGDEKEEVSSASACEKPTGNTAASSAEAAPVAASSSTGSAPAKTGLLPLQQQKLSLSRADKKAEAQAMGLSRRQYEALVGEKYRERAGKKAWRWSAFKLVLRGSGYFIWLYVG